MDDEELTKLAEKLRFLYVELGSWQKVANEFDVPKIVVWRIAKDGYEPQKNNIRRKLGLREKIVSFHARDNKGRFARKATEKNAPR